VQSPRAGDELGLLTKARMLELTGQGRGAEDRGDGRVEVTVHDIYGDIATASVDSATDHEYLHLVRTPSGWQIAKHALAAHVAGPAGFLPA
jgi:hypothetical protein